MIPKLSLGQFEVAVDEKQARVNIYRERKPTLSEKVIDPELKVMAELVVLQFFDDGEPPTMSFTVTGCGE
jgi:hypothetical protein